LEGWDGFVSILRRGRGGSGAEMQIMINKRKQKGRSGEVSVEDEP